MIGTSRFNRSVRIANVRRVYLSGIPAETAWPQQPRPKKLPIAALSRAVAQFRLGGSNGDCVRRDTWMIGRPLSTFLPDARPDDKFLEQARDLKLRLWLMRHLHCAGIQDTRGTGIQSGDSRA